ncbi:MAG: VOC family protein [Geminicoccaceae bacterium]
MAQSIFPALRYRDAQAAIAWLEHAFGFRPLAVHAGADGSVAHAELALDGGVIMLGSTKPDAYGARSPHEIGEVSQSLYVWVAEVDAHHARAAAAGADVFRPPENTPYGSREYSCRDPEGHVWSFGNYRPETSA